MFKHPIGMVALVAILATMSSSAFAGKPLKVFILAGQSNMEGQARVRTIKRLPLTDDSQQMYQDMNVKSGLPSAPEGVYGVFIQGDDMRHGKPRSLEIEKGPLKPGYDKNATGETKFGPEYTFGIYMQKHLNEPILIIKTAWGGRDLMQQFRPPSAGKLDVNADKHGNPTGHYYNTIVKRTKEVLANPGAYHPAYNPKDGFEIAGFVWFQGFNDMVGAYPETKDGKDYSEYTRLLACFIRDIRKDLGVPQMPVVIGVMGIDGPIKEQKGAQYQFRNAQLAVTSIPEFKGTVQAVRTDAYWDQEFARIDAKLTEACQKEAAKDPNPKKRLNKVIDQLKKTLGPKVLTSKELALYKDGFADEGYHYMGSAYIYGKIGQGFADAMAELMK